MAGALSPVPRQTFFANDGSPLAGGLIYTYSAGTLTPKTMYSDTGLSVPISNPIVLNSAGRPQASAIDTTEVALYPTSGSYKWIVKNSSGSTIWSQDDIPSVAILSGTVTSVGLSMPSIFSVANSPVTSTGTLTVTPAANTAGGLCQGRLTLTSGTAVTTGDVTAATSVYFTPFHGNLIDLFDGASVWNTRSFTELTLALGTITSALPYDVFAYDNSGIVALRSPVAWTNTTTRATALTLQNGVYVKTGATTDRYLGTFYTTSTTTTEDSAANAFLWNYYNRIDRDLLRQETTANWNYSTATIRQANGAAANQVNLIIGVAEDPVHLQVHSAATNSTGSCNVQIGIGKDSTSTLMATMVGGAGFIAAAGAYASLAASVDDYPAVGKHSYMWNEWSGAVATTTFFGSSLGEAGNFSGIRGWTKH